ncbi:hypothetical protein H0X48_01495 [Candidatus Dependentiae bacterium]|nr:hypothetical protein [Candidatus Dependentiae bacterium]
MFKHTRYGILAIALQFVVFGLQAQLCNGFKELCNKRYNDIAFVEAHDAVATSVPYGSNPRLPAGMGTKALVPGLPSAVSDQEWTIDQQLANGVRVFEFSLQYDYPHIIGYYVDLLKRLSSLLATDLSKAYLNIQTAHASDFKRLNDAQAHVNNLQNTVQSQVNSINNQIASLDSSFNKLPKFSLTGRSKATEGIGYGIKREALEAQKLSIQVPLAAANTALNFARKTWQTILNADPRITQLKINQSILQKATDIAVPQTSSIGRQIYACHGLLKSDFYNMVSLEKLDGLSDLLKLPSTIATPLKDILKYLNDTYIKPVLNSLVGSKQDGTGGLFPYPGCLIDPAAITLRELLAKYKNWLDRNPNDVLTLNIEDHTDNNAELTTLFNQSGLPKYMYVQNQTTLWPTLGELIKTNKRLIVFMRSPITGMTNDANFFFPVSTTWSGFNSADKIIQEDPVKIDAIVKPDNAGTISQLNQDPKNKLFDFTHNITIGLSGNKNAASQINKKSVVLPRMVKIAKGINHVPNFVRTDFVNLPNSEIFDAVNEFNGVGKYAGKPAWTPTPPAMALTAPKK